ncbi:hypothetical protein Droror1_Dr00014937 [Drosera rotundifolia]
MASMKMVQTAQLKDAEIYQGAETCKQKSKEILEEMKLPNGLLPLSDMVEFGFNRSTGYFWVKQKKSTQHRFQKVGKTLSYDAEVAAFVEEGRMKRITGVKSKELLIWVSLSDLFIDDPSSDKISFGTSAGISRPFPFSAFVSQDAD